MTTLQKLDGFQGQVSDIGIYAKEIRFMKSELNEIVTRHMGQKIETIDKDTDRYNFCIY